MDNELVDMPEIPDVPDEDDEEEGFEGDAELEEAGAEADAEGRPPAILAALAPVARLLGPALRPLAPVAATAAPIVARVPPLVLTSVGSGLAIVVLVVGISAAMSGGKPTTVAVEAHEPSALDLLDEPLPTPRPRVTPTVPGPSPTPTPALWEPQKDGGWIGRGYAGPSRLDMLKPERFLLFDDRRDAYTIVTRFSILTATGQGAPLWGIALSYIDENNHLIIESSAGKDRHPQFVLTQQKDGMGGHISQVVPAPELPYWGRDVHELRVTTNQQRIKIWLDDWVVGQWDNKHVVDGGQKGFFAWFGTVMRVESFKIQ